MTLLEFFAIREAPSGEARQLWDRIQEMAAQGEQATFVFPDEKTAARWVAALKTAHLRRGWDFDVEGEKITMKAMVAKRLGDRLAQALVNQGATLEVDPWQGARSGIKGR